MVCKTRYISTLQSVKKWNISSFTLKHFPPMAHTHSLCVTNHLTKSAQRDRPIRSVGWSRNLRTPFTCASKPLLPKLGGHTLTQANTLTTILPTHPHTNKRLHMIVFHICIYVYYAYIVRILCVYVLECFGRLIRQFDVLVRLDRGKGKCSSTLYDSLCVYACVFWRQWDTHRCHQPGDVIINDVTSSAVISLGRIWWKRVVVANRFPTD